MTKIYKGYADLPWFEDILDNGCESLVWFFEELLNDAEVQDLSIQSYIIQYVESGFMKSKWLDKPEPPKPTSLRGKSEYFKSVRKASRQYWLEKAISMGV